MKLKEIMEQIVVNATASVTSFLQVGRGGSFPLENGHMVYSQSSISYLTSIMTSLQRFSFITIAEIKGYNFSKEGNLLICFFFLIDVLEGVGGWG